MDRLTKFIIGPDTFNLKETDNNLLIWSIDTHYDDALEIMNLLVQKYNLSHRNPQIYLRIDDTALKTNLDIMLNNGYVSNETNEDVCMYTCRIYSSRDLDILLYKLKMKNIGKILVYIHSQQRIEKCENCS